MRIRYVGQTAGVIAGWRTFAPGDEDETLEEIGVQLCASGLFEAVTSETPAEVPAAPVESESEHATE